MHPSTATPHTADPPAWSSIQRIGFRITFAYVVLFFGSFSGFFAPLATPLALLSNAIWGAVVPWVAVRLLGLEAPPLTSDADGLAQWITVACCGLLAALVAAIWSVRDRGRSSYPRAHRWLRVIARYLLGIAMFTYGLAKIAHLQMLPPHLSKLLQPLGESSPTSLLWIFMGSSAAYSAFTGVAELAGGLLLFHRRTTTLGALISFAAMAHVVMLNFAYDVSVKIWSVHLTGLALLLLVPELRRLIDFFVLNRAVQARPLAPLFRDATRERRLYRAGMLCLVITLAVRCLGMVNLWFSSYGREPVALWGVHEVISQREGGEDRPPLHGDASRWHRLVIERSGLASIHLMDGTEQDYLTRTDEEAKTITFLANPDETATAAGATRLAYDPRLIEDRFQAVEGPAVEVLDFVFSAEGDLTLTGTWQGTELAVSAERTDPEAFPLLQRRLHWVQYSPYFR